MSKYKHFRVASKSGEHFVELAIDVEVLTPGHAEEINSRWSNADHRLKQVNGDAELAVAQLFGALVINHARYIGGWSFKQRPYEQGLAFAQQVIDSEGDGWPDAQELGIAVVGASVDQETFYTVTAAEQ